MKNKTVKQGRKRPVRAREAEQILRALEAGVVPKIGVQHLLVGRKKEVEEILEILNYIQEGGSDLKVWVGDFGSGKSFMLRTIEQIALQNNFIVSTVDLSPTRRFHASDGKALALYQELIRQLSSRGSSEGNALAAMIERWILDLASSLGIDHDGEDGLSKEDQKTIENQIFEEIASFPSAGLRYELGQALALYAQAFFMKNTRLTLQVLRWLGGQMPTKTEAKRELGISQIINDDNWTDMILNLSDLFQSMGYAGLILNFDELVNLYKLPRRQTRDQNYERILGIYNACKSGDVRGLFVNLAATHKTVFDERRGMSSYGALKGRFGIERESLDGLVDTKSTIQILKPLTAEEIFTLLEKIQEIYQVKSPSQKNFTQDQIAAYMEAQLNRPGADEFLTPRAVIKDFLQLLNLARQNESLSVEDLLEKRFGSFTRVEKDEDNNDDNLDIEII